MLVIENSVCYNRNMPINIEKKSEQILINVTPSTYKLMAKIAEVEARPIGYVARELMRRGTDLYIEDGKLRDVDSSDAVRSAIREAVRREIPADIGVKSTEVHLAPVVATISPAADPKDEVRRMITADQAAEIERRIKPRKKKTG